VLITGFLVSLEMDYIKHKEKKEGNNPQPSSVPFFREVIASA